MRMKVKGRNGGQRGHGRKCEGWAKKGRCTLLIKVESKR